MTRGRSASGQSDSEIARGLSDSEIVNVNVKVKRAKKSATGKGQKEARQASFRPFCRIVRNGRKEARAKKRAKKGCDETLPESLKMFRVKLA